jgi:hypothetical protein
MRKRWLPAFLGVVLLATAGTVAGALANAHDDIKQGTPDLIVDQKVLQNHWLVRDESFAADDCSAEEGGFPPGDHPVLRFAVSTPNIGTGDLYLGDPNAHVAANDGLYELAACHNHFHFRHYATYQLIGSDGRIWRTAKRGFCMIDVVPAPQSADFAQKTWAFRSCGRPGETGNQGISAGWGDEYWWSLSGQFFVLDGSDGQPPILPGTYTIRITVNPSFVSTGAGDPCRYHETATLCHQLEESNYSNNVAESTVIITGHPGRTGIGPGTSDSQKKGDPLLEGK